MNKDTQYKLNSFLNDFEKSSQSLIKDIEEHIERMSDAEKDTASLIPNSTTPMRTPVRFTDNSLNQEWETGKFVGMGSNPGFPYKVAWMVDGFVETDMYKYCEILEDQS